MATIIGGVLPVIPLKEVEEQRRRRAEVVNAMPLVQALATHIRRLWGYARDHKKHSGVQERLEYAVRARAGRYSDEELQTLKEQGAPLVYMMLTANKCRVASSWIKDVYLSSSDLKPWKLEPTAEPELPPDATQRVSSLALQEAMDIEAAGRQVTPEVMYDIVQRVRDRLLTDLSKEAKRRAERAEQRLRDQLTEGGFEEALLEFIDDFVMFPAAFIKGPVVRRRRAFRWENGQPVLNAEELKLEWERVSPFDIYPSPWSKDIDDGYLIERHRLSLPQLEEMRGLVGYKAEAIEAVIREAQSGALQGWLDVDDSQRHLAEDKPSGAAEQRVGQTTQVVDALQFWGKVEGRLLREWGMDEQQVPDEAKLFDIEAWLIDRWVIKAVINPDPMGRRPYYKASFEKVPGAFWGRGVPELMKDCQQTCNAAARSLVMNMSLASGPQVAYNLSLLPPDEDLTAIYPWKIWTFTTPAYGGASGSPVNFFQPNSNASELMAVYEKFSQLADEYTGLPRYMGGDTRVGNVGRTASGLSMLISNASKSIQQVVQQIDNKVIRKVIERLYFYNLMFMPDENIVGDLTIKVRGIQAMLAKEQAQVRRNEFLQLVLSSPVAMALVGERGVAELLRQMAAGLDIDVDKVVPPEQVLLARQLLMAQGARGQQPAAQVGGGQELLNGAPVTDNFTPPESQANG